jgi:polysaccharide biosynthesis protein PslH
VETLKAIEESSRPGPRGKTDAPKLNVLVVSTEAPDPFGNAVGRWYYVLAKGLGERGHRVRWLAACSNQLYAERARARLGHSGIDLRLYPYPTRTLLRRKWETLRRPYSYLFSSHLEQDVKLEMEKGYDVLDLEHTWTGWLGIGAPRALLSVLALAIIDSPVSVSNSVMGLVGGALMKRTERRLISRFSAIRVLTPSDARIVHGLNHQAQIFTIPLAIDPSLYPFQVEGPPTPTVGLIGSMDWQPTFSAAVRLLTSVWPRVRANRKGTRLLIAGWGARRSLARFVDTPDVTILEDLPDSEPYFRKLSVLAYPAGAGSGMKVKILEAMAYGVPVVTTSKGIEGIDAVDGVHAFLSDDDDAFAKKIVSLLETNGAGLEMRVAARRLLEDRYSPSHVIPQIEDLYRKISRAGG